MNMSLCIDLYFFKDQLIRNSPKKFVLHTVAEVTEVTEN